MTDKLRAAEMVKAEGEFLRALRELGKPASAAEISEVLNGRVVPPLDQEQRLAFWRLLDKQQIVWRSDRLIELPGREA